MVSNDPEAPISDERELIEIQLERLLASDHFKSAKQMKRFLTYIVNKTTAGESTSIKQYTIGIEALGFSSDFDPDINPSVRIMGSRLRTRLKNYYEKEGFNDGIIINMPKGSYIPKFEKKIQEEAVTKNTKSISRGPKLALLCFSDSTQDNSSNRLLYQIADSIAKVFSQFSLTSLVVSIPHADKNHSNAALVEIKESLKADYSVALYIQQLPKKKYKLIYRLLDVHTEEVLWSDSFQVNPNSFREIIEKVTTASVDMHQGIILLHWSRKLLDDKSSIPKHYQVIAYNRYFFDNPSQKTFKKAVKICLKALNSNPSDVIANIIYAEYCRRDYIYDYGVIDCPLETGKNCAEKAIHLKLNSHEAHYVLGKILFCLNDTQRSLYEFNLAREICSYHSIIEYGIGFHLCLMGKWDEGMLLVKKAMSFSSISYPSWFHLTPFLNYYRQGGYKTALIEAKKITSPSLVHGPLTRCVAYAQLGLIEEAQSELDEVIIRFPHFLENGESFLLRFLQFEPLVKKIWEGIQLTNNHSK